MSAASAKATCPRCGAAVAAPAVDRPTSFPFCSPRCKLVDLSKWLSGSYRIPGERLDPMAPVSLASGPDQAAGGDGGHGSTPSA